MQRLLIVLGIVLLSATPPFADIVELTNGKKLQGKVLKRTDKAVIFEPATGGGTVITIPAGRVRNVTIEKTPAAPEKTPTPTPTARAPKAATTPRSPVGFDITRPRTIRPTPATTPAPLTSTTGAGPPQGAGRVDAPTARTGNTRTRAEVLRIIDEAGRTPQEWWDSVQLNYPKTLNLTWTRSKQWNNQRNLGQFIWDIINPNRHRWREGIKLLHHCLSVNRNDTAKLHQTMDALARMYQNLLGDHARAAFWWRKLIVMRGRYDPIALAECYWKLGSKEMAVEIVNRFRYDPTGHGALIKLWSDMGETDRALELARQKGRTRQAHFAWMAAGDACRLAGRYSEAIQYYQQAIAAANASPERNNEHVKRLGARARASIEAIKVFDALDLSRAPNGTYKSNSIGYRGQIYVDVVVKAGRIEDVRVTKHSEKQYYSSIEDTTRQIIEKQGVKGVDATSRATITSEAIINATAKALARGMTQGGARESN